MFKFTTIEQNSMFMHDNHRLINGKCSCVFKSSGNRNQHRWFLLIETIELIFLSFLSSLSQYEVSSSFGWKKETHHRFVSVYWFEIKRRRRKIRYIFISSLSLFLAYVYWWRYYFIVSHSVRLNIIPWYNHLPKRDIVK